MRRVQKSELKGEIIRRFWSQSDFAEATKLPESRVSKILNGRLNPSAVEKKKFAEALGEDLVRKAFDDTEVP